MSLGCLTVKKNLHAKGRKFYMQCTRCGADEETINHVFLSALQQFMYGLS